ncbi:MAG: hypothetical protein IKZ52_09725 [Bacteroidales bacterium]|nr:hypothetical protein [Bacteroidales bacterium]
MRKNWIIALLAAVLLFVSSCKNKNDEFSSPEKVMEKFSVAFVTADFDNMYKYSVVHDVPLIRNLQKYMRNNPEQLKKMNAYEVTVENTQCEYINDSLAVCKCNLTCDKKKQTLEFRVKKHEEKWLVDISID